MKFICSESVSCACAIKLLPLSDRK